MLLIEKYIMRTTLSLISLLSVQCSLYSMNTIDYSVKKKYPYAYALAESFSIKKNQRQDAELINFLDCSVSNIQALENPLSIEMLTHIIRDTLTYEDYKKQVREKETAYKQLINQNKYIQFFYNKLPATHCICGNLPRPESICIKHLATTYYHLSTINPCYWDGIQVLHNLYSIFPFSYYNKNSKNWITIESLIKQWFYSVGKKYNPTDQSFSPGKILNLWGNATLDFRNIDDNLTIETSRDEILTLFNAEAENIYNNQQKLDLPYTPNSSLQSLSEPVSEQVQENKLSISQLNSTSTANSPSLQEQIIKHEIEKEIERDKRITKPNINPPLTPKKTPPSAPSANDIPFSFHKTPSSAQQSSLFSYLFQWDTWSWINYFNPWLWFKKIFGA